MMKVDEHTDLKIPSLKDWIKAFGGDDQPVNRKKTIAIPIALSNG